ncbi:MAG: type II toxin-antitoxin system HicB family antitoxin [Candidatus Brocadiales bacterium]
MIIKKGKNNYGACVPDLPGYVAVGETKEEVLKLIREAIELHLESMREEGVNITNPTTTSKLIEV